MDAESVSYAPGGPWPSFSRDERRVLGTLIEKSKTSADGYPMSINALVAGCNQKSNRDPVLELDEDEVMDALNLLKAKALVTKVFSGRSEKWRHLVYEQWHLDSREMAIIAELLLRGPQTEGEIRTRASRMVEIPDLDSLKGYLKPLLERRLVQYLTPEDRRGAVITHGFHGDEEFSRLKVQYTSVPASVAHTVVAAPSSPKMDDRIPVLEAGLASLRDEVARLREEVAILKRSLGG
ncbi:MAG: DUF480 domain-containing protein [Planctomycetia bacterium]|nr:DUF480 domain-containing protein [Planctomycetia bacterium]